jgi:hypothetical protein
MKALWTFGATETIVRDYIAVKEGVRGPDAPGLSLLLENPHGACNVSMNRLSSA